MSELLITLPVQPVACPRPRVTKYGTYYPKTYKDFIASTKALISEDVIEFIDSHKQILKEGPLHVEYIFVFKRPKALQAKKYPAARISHIKRPDLDNLIKAINDLLQNTGLIKDDSLICSFTGSKFYAEKEESPSIIIKIKRA